MPMLLNHNSLLSNKVAVHSHSDNDRGKNAYLVVNVACKCGLTNQSYKEMQELYEKYNGDLEILAFPCNNFAGQEPGTNAEIVEFARKKGATFPIFGKIECESGEATVPLYKFLRSSLDNWIWGQGLKWNFTKFLCDKDGKPVKRYGPHLSPLSFEGDIKSIIEQAKAPKDGNKL
jgi:glutathione peroxidase